MVQTRERSSPVPEVLLSETVRPHVRQITLNRPDDLNAMNAELGAALHQELESVAADRSCRAVVLTGAGRGFCAGLDLRTGYGAAPGNDGSDAAEAERIGLVAEVVDGERLVDRAVEAAEQIAALAPWGVRLTKQGMWTALEIPSEQAAVEYEDRQQIMATHGNATGEAIAA